MANIISGLLSNNKQKTINASPEGHLEVAVHEPVAAFGELLSAKRTPVVGNDFIYGINSELVDSITQGSGGVTESGGLASCATAAASGSLASLRSKRILKYKNGIGAEAMFTAMWNAAAAADPAGATSTAGVGTAEAFLGWGYIGGYGFGIIHNETATREIQTLTIAVKSSDVQVAVVTLAGVAYNVNLTNGANTAQTAYEIATGVNYNATYPGWTASAVGSTVVFVATTGGNQTGTFSLSCPTSGSGTFAETTAGATGTTTFIPQSSWNVDTMDGSRNDANPSGITLNTQKLNVYRILYQYLGGGNIFFFIEDPDSGELALVHMIKRANAGTTPSLKNPGGPVQLSARNSTNTTAVGVSTACIAAFVQGERVQLGVKRAYSGQKASVGTTSTPLFTIRAGQTFNSRVSTVEILPVSFRLSNLTATKAAIIDIHENPVLAPYENYSAVSATTSVARIGTTATTISNGILKASFTVTGGSQSSIDLEALHMIVSPGSWLTFTCRSDSATVDVAYSLSWEEEQ